jgi:hypothetical protein
MRINTADSYEWRRGLYEDMSELFDKNTRSAGIDSACLFSREMLANLERAMNHPDMTPEFAAPGRHVITHRFRPTYR